MRTLKRKVGSHAFSEEGCFRFGKVAIVATLKSKKNILYEVGNVSLASRLFQRVPRNRFDSLAFDGRQLPVPFSDRVCVGVH